MSLRSRAQNSAPVLIRLRFSRFHTQQEAHVFARVFNKDKSRKHVKTGIEVIPEDIIWDNTGMNPKQRKAGTVVSWTITIVLIVFWAALLAFVGGVSNVDSLCAQASWLAWICRLPKVVLGMSVLHHRVVARLLTD